MKSILIIGMGRFGSYTARRLYEQGHEIMGVDIQAEMVEKAMPFLTNGQIGDTTDPVFLKSLGPTNFNVVIVAIGNDFKNSLVTTTLLKEMGVKHVVAEASEDVHEFLLKRVGADDIIYPHKQLGEWAAVRYGSDHVTDFFKIGDDIAVYEIEVPDKWVGHTIGELDIRRRFGISIIGIRDMAPDFRKGAKPRTEIMIMPEMTLRKDTTLLVLGDSEKVRKCFR
ncbi:MAG: NAD-binding protein [bacterium]